ncbi:hypothetical protein ACWPKS_10455 [Coraliomargarita sp. W4R72]
MIKSIKDNRLNVAQRERLERESGIYIMMPAKADKYQVLNDKIDSLCSKLDSSKQTHTTGSDVAKMLSIAGKEYVTKQELGYLLSTSTKTIDRWTNKCILPSPVVIGDNTKGNKVVRYHRQKCLDQIGMYQP